MSVQQIAGTDQQIIGNQPVIMIENQHAKAMIAIQGAQVLSYQALGKQPVLWLSDQAVMEAGQAIRGGIPLCFPWFGKHPAISTLPSHGFARNVLWRLVEGELNEAGHTLIFELGADEDTLIKWPYQFKAQLIVEVGQQLRLSLKVMNTDTQPFEFKFAYHSYFAINNIHHVQVTGLENTAFLDQLEPQLGDQLIETQSIRFTAETDRVYHQCSGQYKIAEDGDGTTDILIQATDSPDAVVWNPWIEKTQRLKDMNINSWQQMVCVECGVMDKPYTLAAGEEKLFRVILSN